MNTWQHSPMQSSAKPRLAFLEQEILKEVYKGSVVWMFWDVFPFSYSPKALAHITVFSDLGSFRVMFSLRECPLFCPPLPFWWTLAIDWNGAKQCKVKAFLRGVWKYIKKGISCCTSYLLFLLLVSDDVKKRQTLKTDIFLNSEWFHAVLCVLWIRSILVLSCCIF